MVEIKKNGEKNCKWDSKKDIPYTDIPEPDQPGAVECGKESLASGQCSDIDVPHLTNVHEASKEYNGQRCAVVLEELSNDPLE
jgi:hypothetical protein